MKVLILFLLTLLAEVNTVLAQNQYRATAGIDVGAGFNSSFGSPAILYHEEAGFHRVTWFKVGVGIRAWGIYGGPVSLTSQNDIALRDALEYQSISVNGASFVLGANFRVWKLDIGANTDAFAFAFGSKRHAFYPKNTLTPGEGADFYNKQVLTMPVNFNAFPLIFSKQNGQSEIYARIWIRRGLGIKLGYLAGRMAYVTKRVDGEKIVLDNGQRYFSGAYGLSYAALCFSISD